MGIENKYVHEAYTAIFQQDYKKAIECFQRAISCNPGNHTIYYKLSVTYARNNELDNAIRAINEAIQLNPERTSYQWHHQNIMIRKVAQDAKKALNQGLDAEGHIPKIKKWLEFDPNHLELRWILGLIYDSLGNIAEAEKHMMQIMQINPEHEKAIQYMNVRSEKRNHVH